MACGLRPTTPDQPHTAPSTHEFFKASGNLLRGAQKNGRTQSPCKLPLRPRNEFPPAIPQRVALQQSPPPLRRPDHPANPKCSALPTTRIANSRHRKTTGTSTQLLAQWKANQGRIFYLRIARSLSQRSGPPQIPGFLSGDLSLSPLADRLRQIGHRVFVSGIWYNVDCPVHAMPRLEKVLRKAHRKTRSKVVLIGHSLGVPTRVSWPVGFPISSSGWCYWAHR